MRPKNLQQRISIFVLVPVFMILSIMGWISFLYARNAILNQWSETAITKLQKASHRIDMRISKAKDLLFMLKDAKAQNPIVRDFIIFELERLDGVVKVDYLFPETPPMNTGRHGSMHIRKITPFSMSLPEYDTALKGETVSLTTTLMNDHDREIGWIEVVLSVRDLIDQISRENWWKSNKAFLIDQQGNILTTTQQGKEQKNNPHLNRFGRSDILEQKTVEAMSGKPSGTVFGPGHPPGEISGFYRLNEAPWVLILISPGKEILKPMVNFRTFYLVGGLISILSVVLFIRMSTTGTTNAIKKVSRAAKDLANGTFGHALPVTSSDEVGELTHNFNRMTRQLKERIQMKEELNLAKEVQQSLLPPTTLTFKNLEISGRSVYCDETGGDFFDIIEFAGNPSKICVAVGDVVGHGIGAALLMTTTRALLRGRITQGGSLSQVMNDLNRMLCLDTGESGSFVTLFLFMIDTDKNELQWVRAGHDPAMVFRPEEKKIQELGGPGIALGVEENHGYAENIYSNIQKDTIILAGTDGVWEAENQSKERFGKKRLYQALKNTAAMSSEKIVNLLISETENFRAGARQTDDITLVAVKFL